MYIPNRDHVVVDLLQFLLGGLQCIGRRVELVGLEALIGEPNGEVLVILLKSGVPYVSKTNHNGEATSRIEGSTNLRYAALSLRRGGVGGDGTTGKRRKSLAPQKRSLTGPHGAREHDGQRGGIWGKKTTRTGGKNPTISSMVVGNGKLPLVFLADFWPADSAWVIPFGGIRCVEFVWFASLFSFSSSRLFVFGFAQFILSIESMVYLHGRLCCVSLQ